MVFKKDNIIKNVCIELDLFDYVVILIIVILEGALLYVNYIARIRLGAREMNPIWRKFDLMEGKMKFMSFILMPIIVIGGVLVLFSLPRNLFDLRSIYLSSGILIGFLSFNFIVDYLTLYNFKKHSHTRQK